MEAEAACDMLLQVFRSRAALLENPTDLLSGQDGGLTDTVTSCLGLRWTAVEIEEKIREHGQGGVIKIVILSHCIIPAVREFLSTLSPDERVCPFLAGEYTILELCTLLSSAILAEQVDENGPLVSDPPVSGPMCKSMGVLIKPEWTKAAAGDFDGGSEKNQCMMGRKFWNFIVRDPENRILDVDIRNILRFMVSPLTDNEAQTLGSVSKYNCDGNVASRKSIDSCRKLTEVYPWLALQGSDGGWICCAVVLVPIIMHGIGWSNMHQSKSDFFVSFL